MKHIFFVEKWFFYPSMPQTEEHTVANYFGLYHRLMSSTLCLVFSLKVTYKQKHYIFISAQLVNKVNQDSYGWARSIECLKSNQVSMLVACIQTKPSACRPTYKLTWLISRKSWLTSIMPPSKVLMASARASMVSMSKWLVGSSSSSMCGRRKASQANTTRQRCPSDRFLIGHTWNSNTV